MQLVCINHFYPLFCDALLFVAFANVAITCSLFNFNSMKIKKNLFITALALLCFVGSAFSQSFIREGIWRGEFTVNENKLPFNFEIKGKTPERAVLTLLNGTRRDDFTITAQCLP
jgi:hypothetical protein